MMSVDWLTVTQYVDWIYKKVDRYLKRENRSLRSVIGLVRGGLVPAVMLSHRLDTRLIPLQWQTRDQEKKTDEQTLRNECFEAHTSSETLLIVDDIVDSGKTFFDLKDCIDLFQGGLLNSKNAQIDVIYAALVKKRDLGFDVISGVDLRDDRWVVFPWEVKK